MCLKTVIRVGAKYLPKASEAMQLLSRALELDDKADAGDSQWMQFDPAAVGARVFDVEGQPEGRPLEQLKQRMVGQGVPADRVEVSLPGEAVPVPVQQASVTSAESSQAGAGQSAVTLPGPVQTATEVVRGLFEG
jgi:hypothetical protein